MIINDNDPAFSDMQNIKRRFFALRNGIVADALRKAGDPHKIIFGLTLVQIREVAASVPQDADLARLLWENRTTRCSRLLAPMLMPVQELGNAEALAMLEDVISAEEADVMCHTLLRKLPDAVEIATQMCERADTPLRRYAALRYFFNLVYAHPLQAQSAAEKFMDDNSPIVSHLAHALQQEAQFVLGK